MAMVPVNNSVKINNLNDPLPSSFSSSEGCSCASPNLITGTTATVMLLSSFLATLFLCVSPALAADHDGLTLELASVVSLNFQCV